MSTAITNPKPNEANTKKYRHNLNPEKVLPPFYQTRHTGTDLICPQNRRLKKMQIYRSYHD